MLTPLGSSLEPKYGIWFHFVDVTCDICGATRAIEVDALPGLELEGWVHTSTEGAGLDECPECAGFGFTAATS